MKEELKEIKLYAWLGQDEFNSGEIGIKQASVPAGMIPIVAIDKNKIDRKSIIMQLDLQGKMYGKKICLCEFTFSRVIKEIGKLI